MLLCGAVWGISSHVKRAGVSRIISAEEAAALSPVDCILVLGCQVLDDGSPCRMLADRLRRGVELYQLGVSPALLMSGDCHGERYDEVGAMRKYAISAGASAAAIWTDPCGYSTLESLYRAKTVYGAKRIVVVTQQYHLYRALYIAEKLGMEAWGAASDRPVFRGRSKRDAREVLARVKDFFAVRLPSRTGPVEKPDSPE
jgi:vancomycin permeability regulator SanA